MDAAPHGPGQQQIALQPMTHQCLVQRLDDDWAGVTDQKERRKLQNRLNQRARRLRQTQAAVVNEQNLHTQSRPKILNEKITERTVGRRRELLSQLALGAMQNYMMKRPNPDQLMSVIQLNTINAMTSNAKAPNLSVYWLICHAISPFGYIGPVQAGDSPAVPQWLILTELQKRVPHHPWIDLFPLPRMRDNLLTVTCVSEVLSEDDEEQLWADLVEGPGNGTVGAGLVVWGDAWDPRNWEATVPFLKRWGRLLEGCDEILVATNHWRRQRGEKSLQFKSSEGEEALGR